MKIIRLLLLSLRKITYIRSRSVVWFFMSVFVPSLICAYWIIALRDNPSLSSLFNVQSIVTYYVTIVTLDALLVSHMKEYVMREEIQNGGLSRALLKPYSYYWYSIIFTEFPYRLVQGFYGLVLIFLLYSFFPQLFSFSTTPQSVVCGLASGIMGFFICANIELILGFLAFWFYDMKLIHNAYEVIFIFLGGVNMPLYLFPRVLEQVAFFTPLPYITYIPTLFITNTVTSSQAPYLLMQQLLWLIATTICYLVMWKRGIRIFTAAGN